MKDSKIRWGCPECGDERVIHRSRIPAARHGAFRSILDGSYEFITDHTEPTSDELDPDDTSDEEYECERCGENFTVPGRLRDGTDLRVVIKLVVEAHMPTAKNNGSVEEEVECLEKTEKFEFYCKDAEKVKTVLETIRLMVGGVVNTAKGST